MGKYKHDGKKEQILSELKTNGGSVKEACSVVGVTTPTFYNWIKKDADFREAVSEINNTQQESKKNKINKIPDPPESPAGSAMRELLDRIVTMLREQHKYSGELAIQVELTAQLISVLNEIYAEMQGAPIINVEYSREGNTREQVNPLHPLYLQYYDRIHRALRALGMNVDAREHKGDDDTFTSTMEAFRNRRNDRGREATGT